MKHGPDARGRPHEDPRADRHGAESRQVHRLPHLLGHLQERVDQPARAWNTRGSTTSRPSPASAIPRSGRTRTSGTAAGCARRTAASSRGRARKWKLLMRIFANPNLPRDRRLLRAVHVRLRPPAVGAGDEGGADRAAAQPHHRQADGQDRLGPELGGDPGRRVRQAQRRTATSTTSRRRSTASSRTRS